MQSKQKQTTAIQQEENTEKAVHSLNEKQTVATQQVVKLKKQHTVGT